MTCGSGRTGLQSGPAFFNSLLANQFSGKNGLAEMALGMFRHMNNQAADAGGQLLTANIARLRVGVGVNAAHDLLGDGKLVIDRRHEFLERRAGRLLGLQPRELFRRQLLAGKVSRQPVDAAGDVA